MFFLLFRKFNLTYLLLLLYIFLQTLNEKKNNIKLYICLKLFIYINLKLYKINLKKVKET